ncbi:hypothetical protein AcV5_002745 [Taiwanofungus camphoratus]|nr:hypothetical protein AcV5_002745 [Antrodia cinnamomea]
MRSDSPHYLRHAHCFPDLMAIIANTAPIAHAQVAQSLATLTMMVLILIKLIPNGESCSSSPTFPLNTPCSMEITPCAYKGIGLLSAHQATAPDTAKAQVPLAN